jgi:hypothetical protein
MKTKQANTLIGILLVVILLVALSGGAYISWKQGLFSQTESAVGGSQQINQVIESSKSGQVATAGVYVRDVSNNNINTKIAVAVYCKDNSGTMVIDGTSSSTTAEITGKTSIGKTLTCWAFNSTVQTKEPIVTPINDEYTHIVIDAYLVPTTGKLSFYNDQLQTGTGGAINVTAVGASQTGTLQKIRFTQNNTDKILPLGGLYFATVASSNVSNVDISGSATLHGMSKSSTQIVKSELSTSVTSRKDNWDYVFELDDDSGKAGNQALLMEENDYLETGTVQVKGNGNGCTSAGELISSYAFTKGYYRSTKAESVLYGAENDADSASVVSSDITGDTIYCTA